LHMAKCMDIGYRNMRIYYSSSIDRK
jgi:hypothetical protein